MWTFILRGLNFQSTIKLEISPASFLKALLQVVRTEDLALQFPSSSFSTPQMAVELSSKKHTSVQSCPAYLKAGSEGQPGVEKAFLF